MDELDTLMNSAIADGVFPGAVVLAASDQRIWCLRPYGQANIFDDTPVEKDTVFDLASLTKPLATALVTLQLVFHGTLALDSRVADILGGFGGSDKAAMTIGHLLSHRSGLPAWRPYYEELQHLPPEDRMGTLQLMLSTETMTAPVGQTTLYSDPGFLLLQLVIESATETPLDRLSEMLVFKPLGLSDIGFPSAFPGSFPKHRFAATQVCPWRERLLVGEVDDENAHVLGGVAGHAGLFGSAVAIYRLLNALMMAWTGEQERFFDPSLVRRFLKPDGPGARALGFDIPTPGGSSGVRFSKNSVGHLGFTGTSFWLDLERQVMVVLLTNRVHPYRFRSGIKNFRPKLHDTLMDMFCPD